MPENSFIAGDNFYAIGALILGLSFMGFYIDRTPLGRKTSGVVWVITIGLILSNLGVSPLKSPSYDFVFAYLVPLSIPLLLFKTNLRNLVRDGGPILLTFSIAAIGTILGAVIGFALLDLGDIGTKVAGTYAGGWIGGAVNLVSVARAVELTGDEFAAALAASNPVSVLALITLMAIPSVKVIIRLIPSKVISQAGDEIHAKDESTSVIVFDLIHITGALALSFLICASATALSKVLGWEQFSILLITVLSLAVANLFAKFTAPLQGDFELGMLFMYAFFAAIGLGTDLRIFVESAPILFFYGMIIVVIHLLFILFVARLLKLDLAKVLIGSAAALVGPAVTAAIASSKGWRSLVTPGIVCGLFGYAIATFIGVVLSRILAAL